MHHAAKLLATLLVLGSPAAAQSKLWIVSDTGCPLVHFAEIQPAVNAAAEGDVILVRPRQSGRYQDFTIDGKSLVIAVDARGDVDLQDITVRNLSAAQSVLLNGFAASYQTSAHALTIDNNLGDIWIQDLAVFDSTAVVAAPAAVIEHSESVVLARCRISSRYAEAMRMADSGVYLYDSQVSAGLAWRFNPALLIESGTFYASGSSVLGGSGAPGVPFCFAFGCLCGNGGPGGPAVVNQSGTLYLLDTRLFGGAGGPPSASYGLFTCSSGANGVPYIGPSSAHITLSGTRHSLTSSSPILEGQQFTNSFAGARGENVALLLSGAQQHSFNLGAHGLVTPQLPGLAPLLGVTGPGGGFAVALTMPTGVVEPGFAVVLYNQSLFGDAMGSIFAGAPFAWVILDENHDPLDGCPP